jgi:hypothetical protein
MKYHFFLFIITELPQTQTYQNDTDNKDFLIKIHQKTKQITNFFYSATVLMKFYTFKYK